MERCRALGHRGILFAALFDRLGLPHIGDASWAPVLSAAQDLELSLNFHIGFGQESEERVDEINRRLKGDGFDVPPPSRQHGSWTFYFQAPDGERYEIFGPSNGPDLINMTGAPLLSQLPIDPILTSLCDAGKVEEYRSEAYDTLATNFINTLKIKR